jgi:prepilin-type N-terminal cleavage/methylation domain-containing protein
MAFTLIELRVVIAIIAILAAMLLPIVKAKSGHGHFMHEQWQRILLGWLICGTTGKVTIAFVRRPEVPQVDGWLDGKLNYSGSATTQTLIS